MKYADYIVIPRSALDSRIDNLELWIKSSRDRDDISKMARELETLKWVRSETKPLAPLIEDAFEAGGKRFLDVEKFNGGETLTKEQYLNKEL